MPRQPGAAHAEPLGRIPAAEDADAILYDPASKRVFTLNGDAYSSTVIDPAAGTLITNIALGGKPEYGASAGDGKVYANLTDTNEVVEIDAKATKVTRRWPTSPCTRLAKHSAELALAHARRAYWEHIERHGCDRSG